MESEYSNGNRLPIFEHIHSLDDKENQDIYGNIENNVTLKDLKENNSRAKSRSKSYDADSTDDSIQ